VLLNELAAACNAQADALAPVASIAAAGSLGRLEAGTGSDLDAIVVLHENAAPGAVADALDRVWGVAAMAGLKIPKAGGIFREGISRDALVAPEALGSLDEIPGVFGKRIQFLLDARPLFGMDAFQNLRDSVFDWYVSPHMDLGARDPWEYLLNDLVRYAGAYTNWQLAKRLRSVADSWALRQVKLRSTRFVTWLGLWVLIWQARDREGDGVAWVRERLALTPLERVVHVLGPDFPDLVREFVGHYEAVLSRLFDADARARLVESERPAAGSPQDGYDELIVRCEAMREILGAILAARFCAASARRYAMLPPF